MFKKKYDINWMILKKLLQNFDYRNRGINFTDGIMRCSPEYKSNKKRNRIFKRFFKKCGWKLVIDYVD